jgi:hypothetical protein
VVRKAISKDVKNAEIPPSAVNKIKRGLGNFAKGIKIKTQTNSKEVIRKVDKFESALERAIDKGVKQAGFQLLKIIRTKTQKGIDFNSKPFAPYSEGYLKRLQKEGKETNVDLWYSGKMLGALTPNQALTKTGKHKITLGFARAEERNKALWNQVINSPKREFFGFNNRTEKIINKSFNQFIEKELKRARI